MARPANILGLAHADRGQDREEVHVKRWIVNASLRCVRIQTRDRSLEPGEFFWDGTYADAMAAGQRRRWAEKALSESDHASTMFTVVADRIEPVSSSMRDVRAQTVDLEASLIASGYDVWREGTGLVVLGRPR